MLNADFISLQVTKVSKCKQRMKFQSSMLKFSDKRYDSTYNGILWAFPFLEDQLKNPNKLFTKALTSDIRGHCGNYTFK